MVHNEIDSLPASRETGQQTYDSFIICPCPYRYTIRPKALLPFSINLVPFFRGFNPAPFLRRHNPMPLLRFLNPAPMFALLNPFTFIFLRIPGAILNWLDKPPSNFALYMMAFFVLVFSTGTSEEVLRENNMRVFAPYTVLGTARRVDGCIEAIGSFF
ncbi:hypothetical protein V8E51_011503 [Hyaloscypha variabilis]